MGLIATFGGAAVTTATESEEMGVLVVLVGIIMVISGIVSRPYDRLDCHRLIFAYNKLDRIAAGRTARFGDAAVFVRKGGLCS